MWQGELAGLLPTPTQHHPCLQRQVPRERCRRHAASTFATNLFALRKLMGQLSQVEACTALCEENPFLPRGSAQMRLWVL